MKVDIFSLAARGILGGIWGLTAVMFAYMLDGRIPMFSYLFYPVIFAGAVPLAVLFAGKDVPFLRTLSVGVISGIIYHLLSPVFPLFASVLAGASLGGGLSRNTEKPGGILELILNTLKGSVIVPLVIVTGSFIGGTLYLLTESPIVHWFFWGFWVTMGISFVIKAEYDLRDPEYTTKRHGAIDEFKEDARDIARDLSELNSNLN